MGPEAIDGPALSLVSDKEVPAAGTQKRQPVAKRLPKWESDARERLRTAIKKFGRPLTDLVNRDANEGDTRLLVTDFLCEGLGFDKYADLTTEYQVKGEYADYGVRFDKQLVAFIEVKRVTTKLDAKHLRQVEMYAVNEGVEWAILTNAAVWQVYHLGGTVGKAPAEVDLVLDVNLLSEDSPQHKASQLYYLTKEALKRRQLDEVWRAKRATSPRSICQVIFAPTVIDAICRELRSQMGQRVDADEMKRILKSTVVRPECFEK